MVSRDTPHLTLDAFPDDVVKKKFPLLSLVWHLFIVYCLLFYLFIVVTSAPELVMEMNFVLLPLVMYLLPDW